MCGGETVIVWFSHDRLLIDRALVVTRRFISPIFVDYSLSLYPSGSGTLIKTLFQNAADPIPNCPSSVFAKWT